MHEVEVINPAAYKSWNDLLLASPGHSFFHSSSWAEVLQKSYGYAPRYFTLRGKNNFTGMLPVMEVNSFLTGRRGVSLPFTDYCEPIVSDKAQFQEVFAAAVAFGKKQKWRYLEIRGGQTFLQKEVSSEHYYGHTLDLTAGHQKIFSNLRDSTGRNIKKAQKENVTVSISTSPNSMKELYRLNTMTRREHGLPPQPYYFFQCVYDHIVSKGMGFIALAYFHNTAITANVYFNFGKEIIYKYGASDRAYQTLRANNLVMWEAIKWSCDRGHKSLCFGRTELENEGLRQFKNGWGAREYIIKYYKYDFRENAFTSKPSSVNPLYKKIFKKLPIPVLNILGKILYRHIG
jgi:hypothetical protein